MPRPAPHWMVILNATPDSFSDGGQQGLAFQEASAMRWIESQLALGATWLDIGGESTRPGAAEVPAQEEQRRILPWIKAATRHFPQLPLSVDTRKASVAQAALSEGASWINDVSNLRHDGDALLSAVNLAGAGLILMHSHGSPQTMVALVEAHPQGYDVVADVAAGLLASKQRCLEAGLPPHKLWLDVGLGFAKTPAHNWQLVQALPTLQATLKQPFLLGASRKRFLHLGEASRLPQDRDVASALLAYQAWQAGGVQGFRIHNLALHQQIFEAQLFSMELKNIL